MALGVIKRVTENILTICNLVTTISFIHCHFFTVTQITVAVVTISVVIIAAVVATAFVLARMIGAVVAVAATLAFYWPCHYWLLWPRWLKKVNKRKGGARDALRPSNRSEKKYSHYAGEANPHRP